jgi:hypothetical protein
MILQSNKIAPATSYTRQLLDGASKYGISLTNSGIYLTKSAISIKDTISIVDRATRSRSLRGWAF